MQVSLKAIEDDVQSFTMSLDLAGGNVDELTREVKSLGSTVANAVSSLSAMIDFVVGAKRSNFVQWIIVLSVVLIFFRIG
jgi:hypothetical protein